MREHAKEDLEATSPKFTFRGEEDSRSHLLAVILQ
jgi:hypothetical protein